MPTKLESIGVQFVKWELEKKMFYIILFVQSKLNGRSGLNPINCKH